MKLSLNHLHYRSRDKHALGRWYCEQLGFRILGDIETMGELNGPLVISSDDGLTAISIFTSVKPPNNGAPAFSSDVPGFLALWEKFGRPRVFTHHLFYSFYLDDPDANRLEFCCWDVPALERVLSGLGVTAYPMTPENYAPPK